MTLSPLELLEKLAALVPLPRVHLVRYGGCLAPHSRLRGAITPSAQWRCISHLSRLKSRLKLSPPPSLSTACPTAFPLEPPQQLYPRCPFRKSYASTLVGLKPDLQPPCSLCRSGFSPTQGRTLVVSL